MHSVHILEQNAMFTAEDSLWYWTMDNWRATINIGITLLWCHMRVAVSQNTVNPMVQQLVQQQQRKYHIPALLSFCEENYRWPVVSL